MKRVIFLLAIFLLLLMLFPEGIINNATPQNLDYTSVVPTFAVFVIIVICTLAGGYIFFSLIQWRIRRGVADELGVDERDYAGMTTNEMAEKAINKRGK